MLQWFKQPSYTMASLGLEFEPPADKLHTESNPYSQIKNIWKNKILSMQNTQKLFLIIH